MTGGPTEQQFTETDRYITRQLTEAARAVTASAVIQTRLEAILHAASPNHSDDGGGVDVIRSE